MATSEGKLGQPHTIDTESEEFIETSTGVSGQKSTETSAGEGSVNMEFVLDIPLEVTVELGRTKMLINDLLKLGQGSVIELTKLAGESLDILANQKAIARGEVVVVNEKYGIRLTEVISPMERIERLR
ncbi:MAG: flagellar motor switch protein FliN [bacterium]|nr:flagellar motor switch protein FliN [bacterium]